MSPIPDGPSGPGVGGNPPDSPPDNGGDAVSGPAGGKGTAEAAISELGQVAGMFSGVLDLIRRPIEQYRGEPYQGAFLAIVILLLLNFILFFAVLLKEAMGLCWFFGISMMISTWILVLLFIFKPPPDRSLASGQAYRAREIAAEPIS